MCQDLHTDPQFPTLRNRQAENAVQHLYEVRPRKEKSAASILISDALPFGGLWYAEPNAISNAVGGEFKEW
jgi:hypothetical protein